MDDIFVDWFVISNAGLMLQVLSGLEHYFYGRATERILPTTPCGGGEGVSLRSEPLPPPPERPGGPELKAAAVRTLHRHRHTEYRTEVRRWRQSRRGPKMGPVHNQNPPWMIGREFKVQS